MNKKMLLTTLAVFVAYFLGGWLIYGMLLKSTMDANTPDAVKPLMSEMPNMVMMALGNLCLSIMIAWVLIKTGANSIGKAIMTTMTVNVLMTLGMNLMWSSMMTVYNNMAMGIATDIGGCIAMSILIGSAGGFVLSRGNNAS
jgi:hypothetical protein